MLWVIVTILSLVGAAYAVHLARAVIADRAAPSAEGIVLGAITNFFDTLGIGSFAPTLSWFRLRHLTPDRLMAITMLSGYILPSILQGVIFLIILGVRVDPMLIAASAMAMAVGGIVGVPIAAKAPIRLVQAVVGLALLIAATFFILANLSLLPAGGTATTLPLGSALLVVAAHFVGGILFCFGVGHYGPILALVSLLGMDPRLAFPIMATAGGFAGAITASRSFKLLQLDYRLVLGLALGAIPAVFAAAFLVRDMPLETLRWLVVVVVSYASLTLLWSAARRPALVPDDRAEAALL